eukprot:TRINITY_DN6455_c0_g1_i1.p1 TRINITY_DN6455_c0_g1~~TRINITY_DN6455_c0_g1_i1.p1  ORF type:complete len:109 (-),score=35.68 TRINITY_DN6455_c0_g1_i1:136-462(-)
MCIRDRYQRRVHGESNIKQLRMRFALAGLLLLAAIFALCEARLVNPSVVDGLRKNPAVEGKPTNFTRPIRRCGTVPRRPNGPQQPIDSSRKAISDLIRRRALKQQGQQ